MNVHSQYMAYLTASVSGMPEVREQILDEMSPEEMREALLFATGLLTAALGALHGWGVVNIQEWLPAYSLRVASFDTGEPTS